MSTTASLTPWAGLIDDAAIFPPGNADLGEAVSAFAEREHEWYADLVSSFVVTDLRFGEIDRALSISAVVTSGAGGVAGIAALVQRSNSTLAGLEVALRDPDDLTGNARRIAAAVDAARTEGVLPDTTQVYVELPQGSPTSGWLAAADAVAEAGLRFKFRTGGVEAHLFPSESELAAWIDAALDRETAFKCTAGLHSAIRHTGEDGFEHHGFVNVLLATLRGLEGGTAADIAETLAQRKAESVVEAARSNDLGRARAWFTSFGSCSILEPLTDLTTLGLLEQPE